MNQVIRSNVPPSLSRYLVVANLKCLEVGARLDLDADTYVIRAEDRYVAYRTWMSVLPMVEVFYPDNEYGLVRWLEQFGYSFE